MANRSTIRSNWPKYVLQWGVLAALVFFLSGLASKLFPNMSPVNPEAYCPFGGLEAMVTYLQRATLPCSMTSMQILMGILLAATAILLSKLFCAFLCPIGSVEDLLIKFRQALGINALEIRSGSIADKILRAVKYGLLFWIVYMTVTSSELFCKNIDPYYAVATGFKGEITLWMSIVSISVVILLGFVVKRFWCKYVCPLGAVSNTLKFCVWLLVLVLGWWGLSLLGISISWVWLLGAFCLLGYLLEIFCGKPRLHLLQVRIDQDLCSRKCYSCQKNCPYSIDVPSFGSSVTSVDCTLCGECVTSCPGRALSIGLPVGAASASRSKVRASKFIAPAITLIVLVLAFIFGNRFEIPTVSETWGIENGMEISTFKVDGMMSIKCYGSAVTFKNRMEKVPGVHGVKAFVGSHSVVISYDPRVVDEETIKREMFVSAHIKDQTLDPASVSQLKVVTLGVDKMFVRLDLNYLALQFRGENKGIYEIESEYGCPVLVRVYMDPSAELDEAFFKEVVNRKTLVMTFSNGTSREFPTGFKFVSMDKTPIFISTDDFLLRMGYRKD